MSKFAKKGIFVFLLVFLSIIVLSTSNVSAGIQDPYTCAGNVYDKDGSAVSGATVVVKNLDTGEKNTVGADTITGSAITVTTDANGKYTFELINLNSGYSNGDKIKVTASKSGESGSKTHTVVAGNWGAVVDVTFGETDDDSNWWDSIVDWLYSICGPYWWIVLLLIFVGLILLYMRYSGSGSRRG